MKVFKDSALCTQEVSPIRFICNPLPAPTVRSWDPELLYVECSRCGAPVIWPEGRTTALVRSAGIDPLELDAYCMLATDGCPACSKGESQFGVQVTRLSKCPEHKRPPSCGNA